jgi:hypothetical protein
MLEVSLLVVFLQHDARSLNQLDHLVDLLNSVKHSELAHAEVNVYDRNVKLL